MNQQDAIRAIHERFCQSGRALNERQRRLWAAQEALKIGRGGITLVSKALRMSRSTIRRGLQDLAAIPLDSPHPANARLRKPGGGRKPR
jgi:hypothetical protein